MNKISYNLMKYRAMSPKQKRIFKLKVWFSIYLVATSIYGQYKLPLDAYNYAHEWVVATSKGIALANGVVVPADVKSEAEKKADSDTAKAIEAASEKLTKAAAEASKAGAKEQINAALQGK